MTWASGSAGVVLCCGSHWSEIYDPTDQCEYAKDHRQSAKWFAKPPWKTRYIHKQAREKKKKTNQETPENPKRKKSSKK